MLDVITFFVCIFLKRTCSGLCLIHGKVGCFTVPQLIKTCLIFLKALNRIRSRIFLTETQNTIAIYLLPVFTFLILTTMLFKYAKFSLQHKMHTYTLITFLFTQPLKNIHKRFALISNEFKQCKFQLRKSSLVEPCNFLSF